MKFQKMQLTKLRSLRDLQHIHRNIKQQKLRNKVKKESTKIKKRVAKWNRNIHIDATEKNH